MGRVNKDGPVGPDQIGMIDDAITKGLDLRPDDVLLDLCCGNGALTDLIFARCRGGIGVDFTPSLIDIAKTNFERPPDRLYQLADVQEFVDTTDETERFNKVMCYGSFPTLLPSKAAGVLTALRRRFPNVQRVFIGNLRLNRAGLFFDQEGPQPLQKKKKNTQTNPNKCPNKKKNKQQMGFFSAVFFFFFT